MYLKDVLNELRKSTLLAYYVKLHSKLRVTALTCFEEDADGLNADPHIFELYYHMCFYDFQFERLRLKTTYPEYRCTVKARGWCYTIIIDTVAVVGYKNF